jgi:hypothetical protein
LVQQHLRTHCRRASAGRKPTDDDVAKSNQFVILRDVDKVADRSTQCFKGRTSTCARTNRLTRKCSKRFNRKETYWGPDPDLIPWHEPDVNTAYGYDPFGNRIQIGIIAKRPMHHGEIARFRTQAV